MRAREAKEGFAVQSITRIHRLDFVQYGLSAKDLGPIILTGIRTLIGAEYAFRLSERNAEDARLTKRIYALNKALISVGRQLNAVEFILDEVSPCDTPEKRLFGCRAAMLPEYSDLRIDIESLSFRLDSLDPNLLLRLSVE
jgi:hypothetical protein